MYIRITNVLWIKYVSRVSIVIIQSIIISNWDHIWFEFTNGKFIITVSNKEYEFGMVIKLINWNGLISYQEIEIN